MVPHLTTALNGPLLALEKSILSAMPKIEHWFRTQWLEHSSPFYASVDLRNAGFKLAPVDTNLFPGGFNNLNPAFTPLCVQAATVAVEKICPEAHRLLLIPENHTRNTYYLRNVAALANILRQAGLDVRIGSINPEITQPTSIETHDGQTILLEPVRRVKNRLVLEGFDSCAVLLNNDLSGGIPEILQGIEQNLIPPLHAGWATRRKSQHFSAYNRAAKEFSEFLGIDEWLINPYFDVANGIDFHARVGEDEMAAKVETLLAKIKKKYDEYGVDQEPFLIVKADAGTYGMGIMTVKSPEDVRDLNRKQRARTDRSVSPTPQPTHSHQKTIPQHPAPPAVYRKSPERSQPRQIECSILLQQKSSQQLQLLQPYLTSSLPYQLQVSTLIRRYQM